MGRSPFFVLIHILTRTEQHHLNNNNNKKKKMEAPFTPIPVTPNQQRPTASRPTNVRRKLTYPSAPPTISTPIVSFEVNREYSFDKLESNIDKVFEETTNWALNNPERFVKKSPHEIVAKGNEIANRVRDKARELAKKHDPIRRDYERQLVCKKMKIVVSPIECCACREEKSILETKPLACSHTVCNGCADLMEKFIREEGEDDAIIISITCPLCRKETTRMLQSKRAHLESLNNNIIMNNNNNNNNHQPLQNTPPTRDEEELGLSFFDEENAPAQGEGY